MSTIEAAVQIFKKHYSDKSKPEKQKCKLFYYNYTYQALSANPGKSKIWDRARFPENLEKTFLRFGFSWKYRSMMVPKWASILVISGISPLILAYAISN